MTTERDPMAEANGYARLPGGTVMTKLDDLNGSREPTNAELLAAGRSCATQFDAALYHALTGTGDPAQAQLLARIGNVIHDEMYHRGMIEHARVLFLRMNGSLVRAGQEPIMTMDEYTDQYPILPSEGNAMPEDRPE